MFDKRTIAAGLRTEAAKREFHLLYGGTERTAAEQADRYEALLSTYAEHFGCEGEAPAFFSSPGRTEIVGNHTDHNNGLVLAAAVTLDTLAAAAPTGDGIITLYSQGYDKPFVVDTRDRRPHPRRVPQAARHGVRHRRIQRRGHLARALRVRALLLRGL